MDISDIIETEVGLLLILRHDFDLSDKNLYSLLDPFRRIFNALLFENATSCGASELRQFNRP